MRGLKPHDERGGVAVFVAVSLVMLFGFAAFAVDAGALYAERRQLQNGADAAVLAVAWDCANGGPCPDEAVAQAYADDNANDGMANYDGYERPTDNSITVFTSTRTDEGNVMRHWFAQFIGRAESTVVAEATAAWGSMGSGIAFPLTISWCEWDTMVGDVNNLPSPSQIIKFHDAPNAADPCNGPAGQDMPGGFGWLDPANDGTCSAEIDSEQNAPGDTGSSVPQPTNQNGCTAGFFDSLIGETVLVPIFTGEPIGTGSNAYYYIEGFAAFELEAYYFAGGYNNGSPCSGSTRCIQGKFVQYVDYGDVGDWGGGDFGAVVIGLQG